MNFAPLPLPPLPDRPLASVLVSCYNYAAYVADAVDSALGPTAAPVEVIVVDDGSTDGSAEVVRQRVGADPRVRLIEQANAGQAAAMNAAVEAARGEVLCFLDADDRFEPGKVEAVVEAFRAAPEAGFAVHGLTLVDADDRPFRTQTALPEPGWQAEAVLRRGGAVPDVPPTSALSLRRAVADVLFPLPTALRIASDVVIQRLAPLVTATAAIPEPLMRYRVHGANHFAEVGTSVAGTERFLRTAEVGWDLQRAFLAERYGPAEAARLAPLAIDPGFVRLRAHHAYLTGNARAFAEAVGTLAAHRERPAGRDGAVAALAAALPGPLGRAAWGLAYGDGPHKAPLRALRRLALSR